MNNNRKPNRIIMPLAENNYSPDIPNKCTLSITKLPPKTMLMFPHNHTLIRSLKSLHRALITLLGE